MGLHRVRHDLPTKHQQHQQVFATFPQLLGKSRPACLTDTEHVIGLASARGTLAEMNDVLRLWKFYD